MSEADPTRCYLVARYLLHIPLGIEVLHIQANGQTINAPTLVDKSGTQLGLFTLHSSSG